MKISETQIKFVANSRPGCAEDNTEFLIAFYEAVCQSRGIEATWENIRCIMREYKPEHVVRKRRKYIESNEHQLHKEEEYRLEYS